MQYGKKKGQAIVLVLVALGLFLIGGIGLAIDGSHLYAQRQMAQSAADAAAQAGIMSILDGTNVGPNSFGTASFTCTPGTDGRTPCAYARLNGFGTSGSDVVTVDFPASIPGVTTYPDDDPALIRVTIIRTATTGLMRFLGSSAATVAAQATAAILGHDSAVPILVLHPSADSSFQKNGGNSIKICGGPARAIQVNSTSASSISVSGNGPVDLSKGGIGPPGLCTGPGGDFGDFGGPKTYPGVLLLGTDGRYLQPASPIRDPLRKVPDPPMPPNAPLPLNVGTGIYGCPVPACVVYSPGRYDGGITIKGQFALLLPGLYYMNGGGFHILSGGVAQTLPLCVTPNPDTGCGIIIYNTGNGGSDVFEFAANAGSKDYPISFQGPPNTSVYQGILFFQDRTSSAHTHSLSGGGAVSLSGTIYLTNTEAIMKANPNKFQTLSLQGNSGSSTLVSGQIIVGQLSLGGTSDITMLIDPFPRLIRQVALVR